MNRLYYGDCLTVMADMPPASVDLIYLDPPFNSNRDYNAIYKDETGRPLPDQIEAFSDLWQLDGERERAIRNMPILMREAGIDDGMAEFWTRCLNALRNAQPRLLAYLSYMTERLLPMRGVLKPTGSIYLHCDPTASHYIKVMMDAIFGVENFRGEIVWKRTSAHSAARRFGPVHDTILHYTRSNRYTWNRVHQPYDRDYVDRFYRHTDEDGRRYRIGDLTGAGTREGESGKPWRGVDPTAKGRHWAPPRSFPGGENVPRPVADALDHLDRIGRIAWPARGDVPGFKRYLDDMEGVLAQDVVTDIKPVPAHGRERLGYATQKPLALLDRIVRASSNPGDTVFDPFCGCATTLEAAHRLGRRWIGIDIAIHAIRRVAAVRLRDRIGLVEGTDFAVEGIPRNMEGARDLWERDTYQFQKWAVEQVDGFVTTRRTGDGGIDGRLYFAVPDRRELQSMVLEVKGGAGASIADVRALRGVLLREEAALAGLVVMDEPGERQRRNFAREMAGAGDMEILGTRYPRMQMLTVREILDGKRFATPSVVGRGDRAPVLPGV